MMSLTIDHVEHPIDLNYRAFHAALKSLGSTKVAGAEKALAKIGWDNAHRVTGTILRANGAEVTDDQVLDAITDPAYPVKLIEAFGAAISPPEADEKGVDDAISEGK